MPDIGTRHRFYESLHAEHGPVVRVLGIFSKPIIFFDARIAPPDWYIKGDSERGPLAAVGIPLAMLGLPLGSQWARHRRLVAPLFSAQSIEEWIVQAHRSSRECCELWAAAAARERDVLPHLTAWSLDIFGRMACAHEFGALASERDGMGTSNRYREAATVILDDVIRHALLGTFAFLRPVAAWRARRAANVYREAAEAILRRAASDADDTETEAARHSLAGKLAALAEAGDRLTLEEVVQEVMSLLLAGHETSSNTAGWALSLLGANPAAQEEVRAELRAAGVVPGTATYAQLRSLPLLQGVMYEALRLYPTVAMSPKTFRTDRELGGYVIPAGTRIIQNKSALGADPDHFPNPELFDPGRFARGEFGAHGARISSFGLGPRVCVGLEAEVLSILAHTLDRFRIEPGSAPPREALRVTLSPTRLPLRLIALEPNAT